MDRRDLLSWRCLLPYGLLSAAGTATGQIVLDGRDQAGAMPAHRTGQMLCRHLRATTGRDRPCLARVRLTDWTVRLHNPLIFTIALPLTGREMETAA